MNSPRVCAFVSSKMAELAPERQMIKAVLDHEMHVDAWVFEDDAGARPESIQQTFLEEIEAADLYIGLFWKGYGVYTIEEFEHARKLEKDCLVYEKRTELEDRDPQLQEFLDQISAVERGVTIRWFKKPEELHAYITSDVSRWIKNKIDERSPAKQQDESDRQTVLDHVENFWVKGILEKSLHDVALLELGIREETENIGYPWAIRPEVGNAILPADKPMLEIYQEIGMGHSLLILGQPGSGKTTMMLELTRQLIERANQDQSKPIPLIFNLCSWSAGQTIADWLVSQFRFYRVDREIAQAWIQNKQLFLLLDGLDEVKHKSRAACAKAINQFQDDHRFIPLVVCCRSKEYVELEPKLAFEGAIEIQPLNPEQVDTYFERFGDRLAGVRQLLDRDACLRALAETPLMLSVMILAYTDVSVDGIQTTGDIETSRRYLFDTYIERMFVRPGRLKSVPFSKDETLHWLGWLARKIIQHNRDPFLVEDLQPNWLDEKMQRKYSTRLRLFFGLFWGLVSGLYVGLIYRLDYGLFLGFAVGFFVQQLYRVDTIKPLNVVGWSWADAWKGLKSKLWIGLVVGTGINLLSLVAIVLAGGWGAVHIDLLFSSLFIWLFLGLGAGLVSGLVGGMKSRHVGKTTFPNQDIIQSGKNALFVFITILLGVVLIGGLLGGLSLGLIGALMGALNGGAMVGGMIGGLAIGLVGGLLVALIFGIANGGKAVIQHYMLRRMLAREGSLPQQLVPFLDYAANLVFLYKVGGGYKFIHGMFMEHFSKMDV